MRKFFREILIGKSYRLIRLGIGLCAAILIVDVMIDSRFFPGEDFLESIFTPSPHEIYMRSTVILLVLAFSTYVQVITWRLQINQSKLEQELVERKRAEAERAQLLDQQANLANELGSILASTGEGIYGLDEQGHCSFANRAAAEMLGYAVADLVGEPMHALIHHSRPDGTPYPVEDCPIYRAFQNGQHCQVDNEALWRRDGTSFPAEYSSYPMLAGGSIRGAVVTFADITERKRAEEEVKLGSRRFRALIENSVDAITLLDASGISIYDSPAAPGMLGYAPDELIGKNIFPLVHPDDLPALQGPFQNLAQTPGARAKAMFRFRHKNGTWLWLDAVATNLLADSSVKAIVINYRDITERKRAEAERNALLEIMHGAATTNGLEEFVQLIHRSLASVIYAENFSVVFHHKRTDLFEEVFAVDQHDLPVPSSRLEKSITSYVFRTGEPLSLNPVQFDALVARGEVELVGTPMAAWLGAPLKTLDETVGVIAVQNYEDPDCYRERDKEFLASVGEQVALVIERKRAEETLLESEEKYRMIVETTAEGIWVVDKAWNTTYVNPAMASMLGYTADELLGRSPLEFVVREDTPKASALMMNREEGVTEKTDLRMRRKDGTVMWTYGTSVSILNDRGEFAGGLSLVADVTERKSTEEEIKKQLDELQRWHAATLGREGRIIDVKREVNELLGKVGQPPRYPSTET